MITDEELVTQFRNGELNAGGMLYQRYKTEVFSFCRRMLNDQESAGDAAQETFLKMMTGIQSLNHHIAFKAWLFAIARNEVLMVVRHRKIIPMESFNDETTEVWDEKTPFSITANNDIQIILMNAVNCLKPAYREAVLLRDVEQLTYEEIAAVTGTTVGAVKSKLFKSRVILNEKLRPYFEEIKQ